MLASSRLLGSDTVFLKSSARFIEQDSGSILLSLDEKPIVFDSIEKSGRIKGVSEPYTDGELNR